MICDQEGRPQRFSGAQDGTSFSSSFLILFIKHQGKAAAIRLLDLVRPVQQVLQHEDGHIRAVRAQDGHGNEHLLLDRLADPDRLVELLVLLSPRPERFARPIKSKRLGK